jgi:hypothetical protein
MEDLWVTVMIKLIEERWIGDLLYIIIIIILSGMWWYENYQRRKALKDLELLMDFIERSDNTDL